MAHPQPIPPPTPGPVPAAPAAAVAGQAAVSAPSSPDASPASERPPISAAETGGKCILIVEDERPLAHALELKIGHEGFQTKVCCTGTEGAKEAVSGKYACILLDLIMPEMDGFALLEQMRGKQVKTPVIVLSNLGQDEDKTRAKSLGVLDYFVKANTPIAEIVKRVRTVTT